MRDDALPARARHFSASTEEAYIGWVKRYVRFLRLAHPRTLGPEEVRRFLTSLAVEEGVSASTQNQALSALLFLYREVLRIAVEIDGPLPRPSP
ncbi:site-specific integrase [Gemmatimonadota bacterium]